MLFMSYLCSTNSDFGVQHRGIAYGADTSLGPGEAARQPPLFPPSPATQPASPLSSPAAPQLPSPPAQSQACTTRGVFHASSPQKTAAWGRRGLCREGTKLPPAQRSPGRPLLCAQPPTAAHPKANSANTPFTEGQGCTERRWCLCVKPGNKGKMSSQRLFF